MRGLRPAARRFSMLGGALTAPRRQGLWVAVGVLLQALGLGLIVFCAMRYGNRSTLPRGVVAAIVGGILLDAAGAVALSRAFAPGRVAFALGVPLAMVAAPFAIVAFLLTLGSPDSLSQLMSRPSRAGRVHETARGRRRRKRLERRYRSLE